MAASGRLDKPRGVVTQAAQRRLGDARGGVYLLEFREPRHSMHPFTGIARLSDV
jgi:hypothetical protein